MTKPVVFVIDDDEIVSFLFHRRLAGYECVTYRDGREGLTALEACAAADAPPFALFVDLHMPVLDGFDFLDRYQESYASTLETTRLFVMTSSPRERDRERVSKYTCVDDFVVKPVSASVIERLLT